METRRFTTNITADLPLIVLYEELCRAHDGIADFRAKLLALLPIASGTGIFLLLGNQPRNGTLSHLLPIGVFGVFVTLGLFLYELRGIQKCVGLKESAKRLESKLEPKLGCLGTFSFRQDEVWRGVVGASGAALVIYPTVTAAWVYIAGAGWRESLDLIVWVAAAVSAVSVVIVGFLILAQQRKSLSRNLMEIDDQMNGRRTESRP